MRRGGGQQFEDGAYSALPRGNQRAPPCLEQAGPQHPATPWPWTLTAPYLGLGKRDLPFLVAPEEGEKQ